MKWLWRKITNGLESVSNYLGAFGALGLFAVALLDSSLVPMPGGADALTILLAGRFPERWPLYAASAALGSTAGCVILYYISRRAGRKALSRFGPRKQARVRELIERYDVLTVLVASVLPPPFPFKLFVITAGVFRFPVLRFALAIAAGRAFRFGLEAYLAANYGEQAKELFARYYPYIGLGVAALVVLFVVLRNLSKRRQGVRSDEQGSET
ncbi:MAG TPA: VTT domain-containing protein [Pyrinomonadaceae bacterium]|nr:VTT domain-containing protein [Pyrinomonadaceae bacterium]